MSFLKYLKESSLSRIQQYWAEYDTGTITSFRGFEDCGNGKKIDLNTNKNRNSVLKSLLLSKGYGVTRVKGSWLENGEKEVGEESFFVVDLKHSGNLKKDLVDFGGRFDQDAITYAPKGGDYSAISTNKCPESWPGFGSIGKEQKLGSPVFGKTGINGFSRVGGRAFVFESFDLLTKLDHFPTHIRSITHIEEGYPDVESIRSIR
jgi:hypothetical protein